jgi:hypothetical protein
MTSVVWIVGFRGDPRRVDLHLLIQLGHVGISLNEGETIYGFHPSETAVNLLQDQGVDVGLILKQRCAIVGRVYDDTQIFYQAVGAARMTVYYRVYVVDANEHEMISHRLHHQFVNRPQPIWYVLPSRERTMMPVGCNNCATWIRTLGVKLPEQTGHLDQFVRNLQENGSIWSGRGAI